MKPRLVHTLGSAQVKPMNPQILPLPPSYFYCTLALLLATLCETCFLQDFYDDECNTTLQGDRSLQVQPHVRPSLSPQLRLSPTCHSNLDLWTETVRTYPAVSYTTEPPPLMDMTSSMPSTFTWATSLVGRICALSRRRLKAA